MVIRVKFLLLGTLMWLDIAKILENDRINIWEFKKKIEF